jgi:hypothetical protein
MEAHPVVIETISGDTIGHNIKLKAKRSKGSQWNQDGSQGVEVACLEL